MLSVRQCIGILLEVRVAYNTGSQGLVISERGLLACTRVTTAATHRLSWMQHRCSSAQSVAANAKACARGCWQPAVTSTSMRPRAPNTLHDSALFSSFTATLLLMYPSPLPGAARLILGLGAPPPLPPRPLSPRPPERQPQQKGVKLAEPNWVHSWRKADVPVGQCMPLQRGSFLTRKGSIAGTVKGHRRAIVGYQWTE